jgi:hypothetical protein
MKQVISIADFATMLNVINDKINEMEDWAKSPLGYSDPRLAEMERKSNIEQLNEDKHYQSLLHAKKALEECKVEIEVPDLEVENV